MNTRTGGRPSSALLMLNERASSSMTSSLSDSGPRSITTLHDTEAGPVGTVPEWGDLALNRDGALIRNGGDGEDEAKPACPMSRSSRGERPSIEQHIASGIRSMLT